MQPDQFIPTWQRTKQLIDLTNSPITVPAGTFQTMDFQNIFSNIDGTPIDSCGNWSYIQYNHYGLNVGSVKWNSLYYNEILLCKNRESRLINYYIP
ncbi:MAG: hypothetical protein QNL60_07315 [Flavobacteriales bacterium]